VIKEKEVNRKGSVRLGKHINDAGWKIFANMLCYKAEGAGCRVVFVNPINTSQECSNCHKIVEKKLSEKIHSCPYCGLVMDRDLNAAINILERAQNLKEAKETEWTNKIKKQNRHETNNYNPNDPGHSDYINTDNQYQSENSDSLRSSLKCCLSNLSSLNSSLNNSDSLVRLGNTAGQAGSQACGDQATTLSHSDRASRIKEAGTTKPPTVQNYLNLQLNIKNYRHIARNKTSL